MTVRRLAVLLFVVPLLVACGGEEDSDPGAKEPTPTGGGGGDAGQVADACDLLTPAEVTQTVGAEVGDGVGSEGPVTTGGTQSTCTWEGVDGALATATLTVYSEASAADSVRQPDSTPVPEVGDDAFVGPFASVWAYADDGSFSTQWYDFDTTEEENLPRSTALALLVLGRL